jgi:hypothetical protein
MSYAKIDAVIGPLIFPEVDKPYAAVGNREPSSEAVLSFMCTPGIGSDVQTIVNRYREISIEQIRLNVAPAEERMLDKLVWPLRHAKACYMMGNYLGTISLCGMVAEMTAILLFDISDILINNKRMTVQDEKRLFGCPFEKLGQERRTEVLHVYKIIDEELKKKFDLIRAKRRKYLHLWSQDHNKLPNDAVDTYNAAVSIAVNVIGQDIKDNCFCFKPAMQKYLQRKGMYKSDD